MLFKKKVVPLQSEIINAMVYKYDFLIIGAGAAGMSYALKVARANKGNV